MCEAVIPPKTSLCPVDVSTRMSERSLTTEGSAARDHSDVWGGLTRLADPLIAIAIPTLTPQRRKGVAVVTAFLRTGR